MNLPIVANIFSILSLMLVCFAYFVKKKELYLLFELLCIIALILSFFFTLEFVAMLGLLIGLSRTLTFYIFEKKNKNAPIIWSFVFSFLTIISSILVSMIDKKGFKYVDLLFIVSLCMYAFIFRVRNIKLVKYLMIVPSIISIIYNLLSPVPLNALTYLFELASNIISIIMFSLFRKKVRNIPKETGNERN